VWCRWRDRASALGEYGVGIIYDMRRIQADPSRTERCLVTVRAAPLLSAALSFENTCSMVLRSGE
jgi:hypothetical protein